MKDEEMARQKAEEYALKNKKNQGSPSFGELSNYHELREGFYDGFLAGLKAGRPQWHKVADGDLPNTEREVLIFMWGSYYLGYYKQYDGKDSSWHFEDFDEESEQVIAWCEIPTFDKE